MSCRFSVATTLLPLIWGESAYSVKAGALLPHSKRSLFGVAYVVDSLLDRWDLVFSQRENFRSFVENNFEWFGGNGVLRRFDGSTVCRESSACGAISGRDSGADARLGREFCHGANASECTNRAAPTGSERGCSRSRAWRHR